MAEENFVSRPRKNTNDWELTILKQEIELLKREQMHLTKKKNERVLTRWEITRLSQVFTEITNLHTRFWGLQKRVAVMSAQPRG